VREIASQRNDDVYLAQLFLEFSLGDIGASRVNHVNHLSNQVRKKKKKERREVREEGI
jgi:hypothetical protein